MIAGMDFDKVLELLQVISLIRVSLPKVAQSRGPQAVAHAVSARPPSGSCHC